MPRKEMTSLRHSLILPHGMMRLNLGLNRLEVMASIKTKTTQMAGLQTAQTLVVKIATLRSFYTKAMVSRGEQADIRLNPDFFKRVDILTTRLYEPEMALDRMAYRNLTPRMPSQVKNRIGVVAVKGTAMP